MATEWCKIQVVDKKDRWIPLQDANKWIYFIEDKITLKTICDKQLYTNQIQKTGLITIESGCEVVNEEMTIAAINHKTTEGEANFLPTINLKEIVTQSRNTNNLINNTVDINTLQSHILQLKEQNNRKRTHSIIIHGTQITILMIITLVGLISKSPP
jgi:hypothetical protein